MVIMTDPRKESTREMIIVSRDGDNASDTFGACMSWYRVQAGQSIWHRDRSSHLCCQREKIPLIVEVVASAKHQVIDTTRDEKVKSDEAAKAANEKVPLVCA